MVASEQTANEDAAFCEISNRACTICAQESRAEAAMKKSRVDRKNGNAPAFSSAGASPRNYGLPLPGVIDEEFGGSLIVIEGIDGSGRSTQISLLTEWLAPQVFDAQTVGAAAPSLE